METWIADCVKNHPRCRNDSRPFVPTRLLDATAFPNSDDIRLVRLDLKLSPARYVALSHCWGPTTQLPITTTVSTLESRMNRIECGYLSQTFQDAVKLTKQLGQRYLWIGSPCIIQDAKDDWAIEAATMALVYGNSIFTIFALSSHNSTGGCRVNAHGTSLPMKSSRYCDISTGTGRIRLFESPPKQWHIEYGDDTYKHSQYSSHNPLRTRAWTLQERELLVRGIHFSANMVIRECRTTKASSELPWEKLEPTDDFLPWPIRNNAAEGTQVGGPVSLRER
jgi:hypothetical protein